MKRKSVKEELPEIGREIICYRGDDNWFVGCYVGKLELFDGNHIFIGSREHFHYDDVTHWCERSEENAEKHRSLYLGCTYSFFVGWLRHGSDFLAVAVSKDKADKFSEKFKDLEVGEVEAPWVNYITINADYWAIGVTPSEALKAVEDQIK